MRKVLHTMRLSEAFKVRLDLPHSGSRDLKSPWPFLYSVVDLGEPLNMPAIVVNLEPEVERKRAARKPRAPKNAAVNVTPA